MEPDKLFESLYLGDRGIEIVQIDCGKREVSLQVNLISRIPEGSTTWSFNQEGRIEQGRLVFSDVESISFEPAGLLPNDFVQDIAVSRTDLAGGKLGYVFDLWIGSLGADLVCKEVLIRILAHGFHLEDPARPGIKITT